MIIPALWLLDGPPIVARSRVFGGPEIGNAQRSDEVTKMLNKIVGNPFFNNDKWRHPILCPTSQSQKWPATSNDETSGPTIIAGTDICLVYSSAPENAFPGKLGRFVPYSSGVVHIVAFP